MISSPPPQGSNVEISNISGSSAIRWKNLDNVFIRLAVGAFLLFWLGGWYSGERHAVESLWKSYQQGKPLEMFLLFWLGGWTIGGVVAVIFLTAMVRGAGHSELILGGTGLLYKPGRTSFPSTLQRGNARRVNPFTFLRQKKPIEAKRDEVTNLQLSRMGEYLRLSFDVGAERIEVGEALMEPEKEWLHKVLGEWKR